MSLVRHDSAEKSIVSFISKITVYVGTSLLQYASLLHRLTNDSSLAQSAAEHTPDHDGAHAVGQLRDDGSTKDIM